MSNINRYEQGTNEAGRPKSGKFAEKRRTEAETASASGNSRELEQDLREALACLPRVTNGSWMNRTEVPNNREDIRQEAAVELWKWAKANRQANLVEDHGSMMRRLLTFQDTKVFNGGEHQTAGMGRQLLHEARVNLEATLGRGLLSKELNQLADVVQMSFPAARRPNLGHQNQTCGQNTNWESAKGEHDSRLAAEDLHPWSVAKRGETDTVHDRTFGRAMDRVELRVESQDYSRATIRGMRSEANGETPAVQPLRSGCARKGSSDRPRFVDGLSTPGEEDLFAPFGGYDTLRSRAPSSD